MTKLSTTVMFAVVAIGLSGSQAASASASSCREAVERYNDAADEVVSRIRRYSSCVADSRGHEDCSSEFSRLKSAHGDFEDAVSSIEDECER